MKAPKIRRYTPPHETGRRSASERGYTHRWAKYAELFRQRHPLCIGCDTLEPTAVVDHIVPAEGPSDPLFWEPMNHQPLCLACHAHKTKHDDPRIQATRRDILAQWDGTRLGLARAAGLSVAEHAVEE